MNALYLIPILLLIVLLRARWVTWQAQDYSAKALYYCWRTKQGAAVAAEMSELWPVSHMLTEIWRWDFRRYVICQDHFDAMMDFTVRELAREDRGWDIFQADKQNPLDKDPQDKQDDLHGDN